MTPIDANDMDPLWGDNESMATRREKAELTFKYEGDAVADGTMDMADFGRALMGYAQVITATISEIAPNAQVSDIRLERTEKGSFTVIASVTQDVSLLQKLLEFFSGPDGTALANAATITVGLASLIGGGVAFTKQLKGRKIESRQSAPGAPDEEIVTTQDGTQIQAKSIYINMSQNYYFNEGMQDVLEPTKRPGVDCLKMPAADGEGVQLDATDAIAFVPHREDESETQIDREALLEVERAAFDGGPWRFAQIFADDRVPQSLTATVRDERFLKSVEMSASAFKKKDRILATLESTVRRPHGKRAVYSHVVSQVHKVIPYDPPEVLPGL